MIRFDHSTIHPAVAEMQRMMETNFSDMRINPSVPIKGSAFAVFARRNLDLNISGFVDVAAAHVYQTESDYFTFTFRELDKKMVFTRIIAFEEELPRLKDELRRVFLCQRAHVIAWSLWTE